MKTDHYRTEVSPSQFILAAFCYVTALMIWKVGDVLLYYGQTDKWIVVFIAILFAVAGISFHLEGALFFRNVDQQ